MVITFIHSQEKADQYRIQLRCRNVAEALKQTGYHDAYLIDLESFVQNTAEAQEVCQKADLLALHRYLYEPVINRLLIWKARGKKILVDLDEAIQFTTPDMTSHSFWKMGFFDDDCSQTAPDAPPTQPTPLEQFRWGLRALDGATMSSKRLADDWASTVRTLYLPDYINSNQYMVQRTSREGMITIGVSGGGQSISQIHKSGLLAALESICRQREDILIYLFDFKMKDSKTMQLLGEKFILDHNISPYTWPMLLSKIDIGIAHAEGKYGIRASNIRAIEYSIMKIPWLASNLLPFREMGNYGWLVSHSESQWRHAIFDVVNHLEIYQAEANCEPFLYGMSQDVFENIGKIIATYESVINYQ